jgi:hypothetical protein
MHYFLNYKLLLLSALFILFMLSGCDDFLTKDVELGGGMENPFLEESPDTEEETEEEEDESNI